MDSDRTEAAAHRTHPAGMFALFAATSLAAGAVGAAGGTTYQGPPGAVQVDRSEGLLDVDNPIYYHLRASDLLEHDATSAERLLRRFMERHTSSDYLGAAEAADELVRLAGDRPIAHYNLACAMARLGRVDRAIEALSDAVVCGWRNISHTERDWDLAAIRNDPRYADIVKQMRELIAREQPPASPLRTDPVEDVVTDLQTHAPALLARYHVPGASVALVRGGELVWTGAFEQSPKEKADGEESKPLPMTATTIFASTAPARLSAALAASDRLAAGDMTFARLIFEHENDRLAMRGTNGQRGPRDRAQPVGIQEGGPRNVLRTTERTNRAAALSGEARSPVAFGWPETSVEPASFQLYCASAEEAAGAASFQKYCEDRLFTTFQLANTSFQLDEERAAEVVTGHTLLGTPIRPRADLRPRELYCYTTVQDLGRVLEGLMTEDSMFTAPGTAMLAHSITQLSTIIPGAGLGIDARETEDGIRMQLADEVAGAGCLIRWYPKTGDGVVIAFNSEAGSAAALRLANIALGGGN